MAQVLRAHTAVARWVLSAVTLLSEGDKTQPHKRQSEAGTRAGVRTKAAVRSAAVVRDPAAACPQTQWFGFIPTLHPWRSCCDSASQGPNTCWRERASPARTGRVPADEVKL